MVFLGLHLSTELQDKVKELKKKLTQLEIEFNKNLSEEKTSFEFSEEELSKVVVVQLMCDVLVSLGGLPEDFIKALDRADTGKCIVTLKYPHYLPAVKKGTNPNTRATLERGFNSRCVCVCVCACVCADCAHCICVRILHA